MEQITLKRDTAQKKVETPTSKAKFEIPEIGETVAKIEEAEEVEEEQEIEEVLGFFAGFFGFILARKARREEAEGIEEERLVVEMERIHGKQKRKGGCGCGM